MSRIEAYPQYFAEYMNYAAEVGEVSLRAERDIAMYAVSEKENLCKVTTLETYASHKANEKHIASEYLQTCKKGMQYMVKL